MSIYHMQPLDPIVANEPLSVNARFARCDAPLIQADPGALPCRAVRSYYSVLLSALFLASTPVDDSELPPDVRSSVLSAAGIGEHKPTMRACCVRLNIAKRDLNPAFLSVIAANTFTRSRVVRGRRRLAKRRVRYRLTVAPCWRSQAFDSA